jgi:hypothetical protein
MSYIPESNLDFRKTIDDFVYNLKNSPAYISGTYKIHLISVHYCSVAVMYCSVTTFL